MSNSHHRYRNDDSVERSPLHHDPRESSFVERARDAAHELWLEYLRERPVPKVSYGVRSGPDTFTSPGNLHSINVTGARPRSYDGYRSVVSGNSSVFSDGSRQGSVFDNSTAKAFEAEPGKFRHSNIGHDPARKIAAAAHGNFGQQLWLNHAAAVQWGHLGCAASVSHILRDAGVANVDELSVRGLSEKLRYKGWHQYSFSERRPGDVIIALGSRHGHTGVVGDQRDITYNNHSSNGRWSRDHSNYWLSNRWSRVYVLRAPLNS
jgi:hypothetical protein